MKFLDRLKNEENRSFGHEESTDEKSKHFDIDYNKIEQELYENDEKPTHDNFILETFGETDCGKGHSADLFRPNFTHSTDGDSLDNSNSLSASSSNGFVSIDNDGERGMFNEDGFTKDEHAIFGDFIASELRNMKTDHFRRKLRRIVQKCILDVVEEEDTICAKRDA